MERLWAREGSLLGLSPVDPFSSPGASRRRSDLDFNDVFGGPPRSSPACDARRGAEESWDVYGRRGVSEGGREDGAGLSRARPWTSIGERPVFGEVSSPSPRRKDLGEDFFNDIFKGGDSVCSSPKRLDRVDAFSSTPGSRVLSPARSLPPRREALSGSPLLTSQSSLSRKLAKELEFPTLLPSGLNPTRNESSFTGPEVEVYSSGTKQEIPSKDRQKLNLHASLRQSFSSCRFSHEDKSAEIMDPIIKIEGHSVKEESTGLKLDGKTGQFHFSIYKWASKGVMLVVPSSKDRSKYNSRVSGIPVPFMQGVNLCATDKDLSIAFPSDTKKPDNISFDEFTTQSRDNKNSIKVVEELLPHKLESAALSNVVPAEPGKEYIQLSEEKEDCLSRATSAGSVDVLSDVKPQLSRCAVTERSDGQDPPAAVEGKMHSGRVKGKVREFIKIFNQELSCKPIDIVKSRARSPKVKDGGKNKVEENATSCTTRVDEEGMICTRSVGAQTDGPAVTKQVRETSELYSNISSNAVQVSEFPQEMNEELSQFESTMENFEVAYIDVEEPHYEVQECVVEDIIQEQLPPAELSSEEIPKLDAKIREWSAGKEGNIRSLLSTLQYVLWSGSGWKAVPLVNIIEGASVKKAYQRAMLCLHPDKLQQRGAPLNQKYIAEKVFDVLQEAWDHFNSISAV